MSEVERAALLVAEQMKAFPDHKITPKARVARALEYDTWRNPPVATGTGDVEKE